MAEPKGVCLQGGQPGAGASAVLSLFLRCGLAPAAVVATAGSRCVNIQCRDTRSLSMSPGRGAADAPAGWVGHLHRRRVPHRQRQQPHACVAGPGHPAAAAHCGRARWRRHGALGQRGEHQWALGATPCTRLATAEGSEAVWENKQCLGPAR